MKLSWTASLVDFIETLACRVRVMSLRQVRQSWTTDFAEGTGIDETISQLIRAGLVVGEVRPVATADIGDKPIFAWRPGSAAPECRVLAAAVKERWPDTKTQTPLLSATSKACRLFGAAGGGLPPTSHTGHDLILAEVYVRIRLTAPLIASTWLGENAAPMAERGVKNPDAYLTDDSGSPCRVIESGGRYSTRQIQAFHDHCAAASLPYELW